MTARRFRPGLAVRRQHIPPNLSPDLYNNIIKSCMAGCPLVAANSMEIEKVSSFLLQIREKDQLTTQVPPQPVKVVLCVPKPMKLYSANADQFGANNTCFCSRRVRGDQSHRHLPQLRASRRVPSGF